MGVSVKEKRRWLIEFALVSLVPVLLLGLFIGQAIRSNVRDSHVEAARDRAQLVGDLQLRRALGSRFDLGRGVGQDEQDKLDSAFGSAQQRGEIAHVVVRNRGGVIVYSDNHALIGDGSTAPGGARHALDGDMISQVTDSAAGDGASGSVLDLFTPARSAGADQPVGSMELSVPYGPIAAKAGQETHTLYWYLGFGLGVLWLMLVGVVAGASQRLRRQAAEKEEQALSDGLTGLPNRTMFQNIIERAMAGAGRRKQMGCVMLMDLARFQDVNDTPGHHNRDLLLQRIGSRPP